MRGTTFLTGALAVFGQAVGLASAFKGFDIPKHYVPKPPGVPASAVETTDGILNGTFTQPIDHFNPDKGNFTQRFWVNTNFWKGPGSPVFLFQPGEEDASGYLGFLSKYTLPGLYAEKFGGMVVIIEHRYWGQSLPFDTLTAATLQYLQLPQSMLDLTNFAANATFDLGNGHTNDNATAAPWILMGGSYSGALTAWVSQVYPGTFWGYHASSAVLETITDFYQYYEPIANAIPNNCSADVRAVVQYVDYMLGHGTETQVYGFKKLFGLANLTHNGDFAMTLSIIFRQWQEGTADVYEFCDYLETGIDTSVPRNGSAAAPTSYPNGVGLTLALQRYSYYMRQVVAGQNVTGTYGDAEEAALNDPSDFTDMRQWTWMQCDSPFGWFQVGGGENGTQANTVGLVSSYFDVNYQKHICNASFPAVDGFVPGLLMGFTPEHLDLYHHGWFGSFTNFIFVNGGIDPWRSATVSSDYRPNGPMLVTADNTPVTVIPSGNHCPELALKEYPEMPELYTKLLGMMEGIIEDWNDAHSAN